MRGRGYNLSTSIYNWNHGYFPLYFDSNLISSDINGAGASLNDFQTINLLYSIYCFNTNIHAIPGIYLLEDDIVNIYFHVQTLLDTEYTWINNVDYKIHDLFV